MDTKQTIWDPLRHLWVALTPEEKVRQWFISVMTGDMEIPPHMMMSEVSLKLGGKSWRADILVYDRAQKPLAVVECKRPEVALSAEVLEQAVRYNMVLNVKYIIITNGVSTRIARRTADKFEFIGEIPHYRDML